MAVPPPAAAPGRVASGSPPPVGGPGAERTGGVGWGREAERGAPAQAAAAGSALRSRRLLQEEARRLRRRGGGEAEAAREDAPRLRRERYGAASPARAQAATAPSRRGAPHGGRRRAVGCGQRRLSRAVATPGAGPHPRGSSHGGADKAGWTLERPGGCALGSGGSAARAGVRGSFWDSERNGEQLSRGPPGDSQSTPGLAGARLPKGRASWSSCFPGKGCGGRLSASEWRGWGAGEWSTDLSDLVPGTSTAQ